MIFVSFGCNLVKVCIALVFDFYRLTSLSLPHTVPTVLSPFHKVTLR